MMDHFYMPQYINRKGDTDWIFMYDDEIGQWKLESWKEGINRDYEVQLWV